MGNTMRIKMIDLFGGIGGFRIGIEQALGKEKVEVVSYVEIDRHAVKSYNSIFNEEWKPTDVKDITTLPQHDVICAGFPCQSFSIAGKKAGFDDPRGNLFFEILRLARINRTPYLLLENVKGLLFHDGGKTFEQILQAFDESGYDCQWEVLNSKNFGIPQNRERVFIIANLREKSRPEVFPLGQDAGKVQKVYARCLDANMSKGITPEGYFKKRNLIFVHDNGKTFKLHRKNEIRAHDGSPTLTRNMGTGGNNVPMIMDVGLIRRLTPKECWRLQGFPDWAYKRAEKVVSDTQLYKQAGNAVTVNVVLAIARKWWLIDKIRGG